MRPLLVVVLDILPHQMVEMLLAEHEKVVQALYLDRLDEPLLVLGAGMASIPLIFA